MPNRIVEKVGNGNESIPTLEIESGSEHMHDKRHKCI